MLLPLYLQFGKYKPDWGDIPTWAAAFFALIAGLVALGIFLVEKRRDQGKEKAERRAQAEHVAAWIGRDPNNKDQGREVHAAYISNASRLPVYGLEVTFYIDRQALNGPEGLEEQAKTKLGVLPPGEPKCIPLSQVTRLVGVMDESTGVIRICFRDAAGVRWERDPYGKLTELPSE